MKIMKAQVFMLLIAALSMHSCSDSDSRGIFNTDFSGTYSYTVVISCYCVIDYVGPNDVILEDGIVTKYNGKNVSEGDDNYDLIQSLGLDDLILQAEKIIEQDPMKETIEYHPIYGFISDCYFDVSEQIADEEWGYTISDFEVL